jgi:hypothetical protein
MVGFLEQVRLASFCCKCTFQRYVCIYGKHDKLQQFITTCMMQVACECNSFEGILVVAPLRQEDVKDGYDVHLLQPFIFFISTLMYPHVSGLCTYVSTGRRVEESCTCICFYVCISSDLGDGSS